LALWNNSNEAFHSYTMQIKDTAAGISSAEEDVAALEDQLAEIQAELDAARQRIPVLKASRTRPGASSRCLSPGSSSHRNCRPA
jgi:phage shock protein A